MGVLIRDPANHIVGCEKPLADNKGVVQKLCYKTCTEVPHECHRRKYWLMSTYSKELCPTCTKLKDKYD